MLVVRLVSSLLAFVATAAPAAAQSGGISIPEPTDGALFALGVVGLIVGRQIAKRRG
ncbi:MAG TPA: hypothetical protein PLM58_08585 [Novosphingobium sp.]|uniref:hypothetical protein n=1 Tax=Novosphingobium sp. 28-62-57 TaxID=1970409 RepID=UPI0025FC7980|nr:hypothetical protein [Novosphingobium sp. 28-62-57]HQS69673.1 hypothetical protein [Novosphingobium sp.]